MFIIGSFDRFFAGFIRKEWTRNLLDGYGEYLPCVIHGLRVVQGRSLELQCVLTGYGAGAGFLAPISAFCWREPDAPRVKGEPVDMTYIQPWDSFSSTFGVHAFEFNRRMRAQILPDRRGARYRFSIDFTDSSLADLGEQHKHLHLMEMEDGSLGAFPNNRVLWVEPAMWDAPFADRPDFIALAGEVMAE
ncbi:hypothetical protein QH494_15990 [Sphingomonas sp. AR_OL41]|uniref:hypothetical protein n=1 Tax=Sphingomonas sp. AR_OL41 TaxID=3042729 RepID=UPI0024806F83|nr:hypothetical protein [Sphingomonas sp. AR_OL41]MDH7973693.1 hypothetical protein [Sphingomonas sp. AR_OL41]